MSAAMSSCYWCYRCSRYIRILISGTDSPVECSDCGSGFLVEFGRSGSSAALIGTNNGYSGGGTSHMDLNGTEQYDQLSAVESLSTIEVCAVCMETLGDEVCELPCKHTYHSHCIQQWLAHSSSCPMCRHQLPRHAPAVGRVAGGGGRESLIGYMEMDDVRGRQRGGVRRFGRGLFSCFNG